MLGSESLGKLSVMIDANLTSFNANLSKAKTDLMTWSQNVNSVIEKNQAGLTSLGMGFVAVGAGITGGMGLAVKTFADFEAAMKNVQSISNASQKDFETSTAYAMKLGKETVFSSKQAAEALYYLASAGYSVKDQMAAADSVLKLATATQWGLAQASEFTATTITSFGLKAQDAGRVVDVMAKASAMSQATMEKLGYSLPYVATQAHMLGMSLETTTAALSMLYDGGLKGEMAGERLRGALNTLLDPTNKEAEALEAMGISIESVSPATHSLSQIISVFESHTKLAGEAQWNAANATKIFGERAEGMTVLVSQGSAKLMDYENQLNNSAGAAQKMADIQQEALSKSFEQLRGSIENLLIKMSGELAPTIKQIVGLLENLVDGLAGMDSKGLTALTFFTTLTGGLTLTSGAVLLLITRIPDLIAGLEALRLLGIGLGASLGAVGSAIAGVSAVMMVLADAQKQMNDPLFQAIRGLQLLQDQSKLLNTEFEDLRAKGINPMTMTLGEFKKSSLDAQDSVTGLTERMKASYGDNVKMSTIMADLTKKTDEYNVKALQQANNIDGTAKVMSYQAWEAENLAGEQAKLGNSSEELTKLTKQQGKALKEYNEDLNKAYGDVAKLNKEVLSDATKITFTTTEAGARVIEYAYIVRNNLKLLKRQTVDDVESMMNNISYSFQEGFRNGLDGLAITATHVLAISDSYWKALFTNLAKQRSDELDKLKASITLTKQATQDHDNAILKQALENREKQGEIDNAFYLANTKNLENWLDTNQKGLDKEAEDKIKNYEKEQQTLLKFQAKKMESYTAQKDLLTQTYLDMLALADKHGQDTIGITKYYEDQLMQLRMAYAENYAVTVGNMVGSVADSYIGLHNLIYNTEMDNDALRGTALVRFADWVDKQVQLIKSLRDAYTSLTETIHIVGQVLDMVSKIGSGTGKISTVAGLLESGGAVAGKSWYDEAFDKIWGAGEATTGAGTAATGTSWLSKLGGAISGSGGLLASASLLAAFGYGVYGLSQWNTNRAKEGETYNGSTGFADFLAMDRLNNPQDYINTYTPNYGAGPSSVPSYYDKVQRPTTGPLGFQLVSGILKPSSYIPSSNISDIGQSMSISFDNSSKVSQMVNYLSSIDSRIQILIDKSSGNVNVQAGNIVANQSSMDDLSKEIFRSAKRQGLINATS